MNPSATFIPYEAELRSERDLMSHAQSHYQFMNKRRSVRHFSDQPIPREVIDDLIRTASTAPSGANKQPWTFCVVSNPELKSRIRKGAEEEEFISYTGRMGERWIKDLEPFGTNHEKEFIETCPYIIVVFKRMYEVDEAGNKHNNYYVNESVGIAVGFLLNAIHQVGLTSLTHTPSPMNFLQKILGRPDNERPYLLIPVGYPAKHSTVPDISRKDLSQVAVFFD
ncbi:MAG TPA: nitroreductase family protein [Luteibaculaceae bacterium]|nr:nitroreductase family protein [Luteibaculaceae bacterium]